MENFCFSIDEERYDDRHGHVLSLDGWYAHPERKVYEFELLGDGYDTVELPQIQRRERPDVAQALGCEFGDFLPGFTVRIPEVLKLAEKYQSLELFLRHDEERISIWEINAEELDELIKENLVEYHLDRVEILYDTMLEIQGWVVDQRGSVDVTVHQEDASPLDCRISRGRRPDVVERRNLDEEYKTQEIGFRISAALPEIKGREIILHFCGDSVTKTCDIDIEALRKENKPKGFFGRLFGKENVAEGGYGAWFARHKADKRVLRRQKHASFAQKPLISIVIPLYCTPLPYLKELIESVRRQSYENWQLCLADGSPDDKAKEFLEKHYGREKRIVYQKLKENGGISANTNAAAELAKGEYLMFCDHDDTLEPDALYEIVKAINDTDADVVYTDEDKVSMDGQHYFDPNFKPDFNLFRLRVNNYICHIFVVRKSLTDETGMLRSEFDGAQDFDFILRCCEKAKKITHIPKVLYHWRCHEESTAENPESKTYAFESGKRAIEEHYRRTGIDAEVYQGEFLGLYRTRFHRDHDPLISIIIPNKDHIDDLKRCMDSIDQKSTYKNYEYIIVENNSTDDATFQYYKKLEAENPKAHVVYWDKEFNYSAINNYGAAFAKGEYLLLLNNDTEIINEDCLEELLGYCMRSDVGAVGARMYYEDDTIQHAGVVIGFGGIAGHCFVLQPRGTTGYCHRIICAQDYSAVTAACMMVKREAFDKVGGLTEELAVAFNDIDFCMKLREAGYLIVYNPYAELYHYESKSRGLEDTPEKVARFNKEIQIFERRWPDIMRDGDPYYNPNLTLKSQDFSLKRI